MPLRALAEQAILQWHALVCRVPRSGRRGGHEPTLFEWAGGLPALTRMTQAVLREARAGRPAACAAVRGHAARPAAAPGRMAGRGTRRPRGEEHGDVRQAVIGAAGASHSRAAGPLGRPDGRGSRRNRAALRSSVPVGTVLRPRLAIADRARPLSRPAAARGAAAGTALGLGAGWAAARRHAPARRRRGRCHGRGRCPGRPSGQLRRSYQSAVSRARPPVHELRVRPVVVRRRPASVPPRSCSGSRTAPCPATGHGPRDGRGVPALGGHRPAGPDLPPGPHRPPGGSALPPRDGDRRWACPRPGGISGCGQPTL